MTVLPWDLAWHEALYGPQGFYRRPEGPAGHFATSAQGIPHGGEVLAGAVLELVRRTGCRRVVDVAAGGGELLERLREAAGASGVDLDLVGVEVRPRPATLAAGTGWWRAAGGAALPAGLTGLDHTLVLAHEWLDVVPCPVLERRDDGWQQVLVDPVTGREEPGPPAGPDDLEWVHRWAPGTRRVEVGRPRDAAFADLLRRVTHGMVLVVDYGHTRARRPPEGTLTGYRTGRQVPAVPDGSCDLTAHVAVDSLGAARVLRQRDALHLLPPPGPAPGRNGADLVALARRSAWTALTDPRGLGGFWWALSGTGGVDLG